MTPRSAGIPIGSLVELAPHFYSQRRGIVVESWTPTVYDARSYSVVWQDTGEKSLVYAKEIILVKNKNNS